MKNKKAVSDIVSTVLIILLVVAAIAIVGAIVLNVVGKTGPKVDTLTSCISLDIKPNACAARATSGAVLGASFIRNAGGADIKVAKVKMIFQDDAGVTKVNSEVLGDPTEFTPYSNTSIITTTGVTKMAISATLEGATEPCPISAPITCTRVP